jgi:hypothetical protein
MHQLSGSMQLGEQRELRSFSVVLWFSALAQGCLLNGIAAAAAAAESVKPRGVVDLSKVQDVRDGRSVTGKANTVQLKTASGGSVCYVCESGGLWAQGVAVCSLSVLML